MIQNLINHIVFVLDASGSMDDKKDAVIKLFDNKVKYLAQRSKELNQETRVSVYLFDYKVQCLIYDTDVLRLPSIAGHYSPDGGTALIDGVCKAIEDLRRTPQIYGDHAFLVYAITDGQENQSKNHTSSDLKYVIEGLDENWTVGVLVPDQNGVFEAKKFGFPAKNISVWNLNDGMVEAGRIINDSTEKYLVNRAKGVRGTKSLFSVDLQVSVKEVKNKLEELSADLYDVFTVRKKEAIKAFVESWTKKPYRVGSAYYFLSKPEVIQADKNILLMDGLTGKVYTGQEARGMIGLQGFDVKVNPGNFKDFGVFVQSNSTNRNLVPGTKLILMK